MELFWQNETATAQLLLPLKKFHSWISPEMLLPCGAQCFPDLKLPRERLGV